MLKRLAAIPHRSGMSIAALILWLVPAGRSWAVEDSSYLTSLFHRIPYGETAGVSIEADVSGAHSSVQQPLPGNGGSVIVDTHYSASRSSDKPPQEMGDLASQTIHLSGPGSFRFGHIDLSTIVVSGKVKIYCDFVSHVSIKGDFKDEPVLVEMTIGMKIRKWPNTDKGHSDVIKVDLQPSGDSPHRDGGTFHLHIPDSQPNPKGSGRLATSVGLSVRAQGGRLDLNVFKNNYAALRQAFASGKLAPGSGGSIAVAAPAVSVGTCLARALGVFGRLESDAEKMAREDGIKCNGGNGGTIAIKTHRFEADHESLSAYGSSGLGGGAGGAGGQVFIEAGIFSPAFKVYAYASRGGTGASGGNGGVFVLRACGYLESQFDSIPSVDIRGADGGSAESITPGGHGGSGGSGGYCLFERLESSLVDAALNDPAIDLKERFRPLEHLQIGVRADGGNGESGHSVRSETQILSGNGGHGGPGGVVEFPGGTVADWSSLNGGRGGSGASGGRSTATTIASPGGRGGDGGGAGLVNGQTFGKPGNGGSGGDAGELDLLPGDGGDAGGTGAKPGRGGGAWASNIKGRYYGKTGGVGGPQAEAPEVEPKFPSMGSSANLAVDYNRDGKVSFGPEDRTTVEKPFVFWINDDWDVVEPIVGEKDFSDIPFSGRTPSELSQPVILESIQTVKESFFQVADYKEEDEARDEIQTPSNSDSSKPGISCRRDLEDFVRLWVTAGIDEDSTKDGQKLEFRIHLEAREDGSNGTPAINLFLAQDPEGGNDHLFDEQTALQQITKKWGAEFDRLSCGESSKALPIEPGEKNLTNNWHLLIEGAATGEGLLTVETVQAGNVIAQSAPIHIKFMKVSEMYDQFSAGHTEDWGVNLGIAEHVQPKPVVHTESSMELSKEELSVRPCILFVHGWRMTIAQKNYFTNTMFKRLWHLGYKGSFATFYWPTFYTSSPEAYSDWLNFDASEERAWNSGEHLAGVVKTLSARHAGKLILYAHSMGNIVCGQALRTLGRYDKSVQSYVAAQAAIVAQAWDNSIPASSKQKSPAPNLIAHYWREGASSGPMDWTKEKWPPYFSPLSMPRSATKYFNHYNPDDYALQVWQYNQMKKDRFFYDTWYNHKSGEFIIEGKPQSIPNDTFKIFAYIVKGQSRALGQGVAAGGCFSPSNSVNLDDEFHFGSLSVGHSAQFRSTIQRRWRYWQRFLEDVGLGRMVVGTPESSKSFKP